MTLVPPTSSAGNRVKFCGGCSETKPVTDFNRRDKNGFQSRCRSCNAVSKREAERIRRTGWTQRQYDEAFLEQNGRCAICNTQTIKLEADHDHATGKGRGLLCHLCNKGLGFFRDNPDLLQAAARYIEENK